MNQFGTSIDLRPQIYDRGSGTVEYVQLGREE